MNLSQEDNNDKSAGLFSDNYNEDFFQDGNGNDLVSNNKKASLEQSAYTPSPSKSILGGNADVGGKSAIESYNDDAFDDDYDDDDFNAEPAKKATIDPG